MNVPFDITKYKEEKLVNDVNRFVELFEKYKYNVDEVLEFADLWKKFALNKRNKYTD